MTHRRRSATGLVLAFTLSLWLPARGNAQCCGDCNGDGQVTINELIAAVNVALRGCADQVTPTTALT